MVLDPFAQKKAAILKEIAVTSADAPDASPKGTIDELCIPMMELLNSHPDMVTTSSCSGRVSVFLEGSKEKSEHLQIGAKGEGGRWIFVTHDAAALDGWWQHQAIQFGREQAACDARTRYLLYKFEPFILHVKCRTLEVAQQLYTAAMGCGFRESGIGSNNIVAVRISIRLDVPIGYLDAATGGLVAMVTPEYLRTITQLSLDRFTENARKIEMLQAAFARVVARQWAQEPSEEAPETKEQRRLRKMEEGMARREAVRAEKAAAKAAKAAALQEAAEAAVTPASVPRP